MSAQFGMLVSWSWRRAIPERHLDIVDNHNKFTIPTLRKKSDGVLICLGTPISIGGQETSRQGPIKSTSRSD
ncbi:hypothetical protein BDN72DRAFT_837422, partial [Pluteus cervinus]